MKMLTTRYKTTINHFVLLLSIIIISPPTHYAHGEKKGRILYDFILIRWAWKNFISIWKSLLMWTIKIGIQYTSDTLISSQLIN